MSCNYCTDSGKYSCVFYRLELLYMKMLFMNYLIVASHGSGAVLPNSINTTLPIDEHIGIRGCTRGWTTLLWTNIFQSRKEDGHYPSPVYWYTSICEMVIIVPAGGMSFHLLYFV